MIKRVDDLVEEIRSRGAMVYSVSRSSVLREAISKGLEAMDEAYGLKPLRERKKGS